MSEPTQIFYEIPPIDFVLYKDAKTCVFWNVEDYPIPNGVDLESICGDMEKALVNKGCGEVSIEAYVDRNTFSDELQRKFSDAKISLDILPEGDNFARSCWMFVDILCWAVSNPSSNIIVLSKTMVEREADYLESLYDDNDYGGVLSKTEPGWRLPCEDSALFLTSLFDPTGTSQRLDNKKRQRLDTLENSLCARAQHKGWRRM